MLEQSTLSAQEKSETHWQSLRYFNLYRLAIACLLIFSLVLYPSPFSVLGANQGAISIALTNLYLAAVLCALAVVYRYRQGFNWQLSLQVFTDILVMTLLMHHGGGVHSGVGILLLVTLAGAGLVGEGRLALLYAASATLALLLEQSYRALHYDFDASDFIQAGLLSSGFFAVAILARLLARRVIANELLAHQRGLALRNQVLISQCIIEEMQDGVLVLNQSGQIKQSNPRAATLLSLHNLASPGVAHQHIVFPELAAHFAAWQAAPSMDPVLIQAPSGNAQLSARFVLTHSAQHDVLVFLEDTTRLQEKAQQIKLAALGRLTANIAHEIRNPLSAIQHASELLKEERRGDTQLRLLRIVLDNTHRLERIVTDVLELGRRDRAYPEWIELNTWLPLFVEEFVSKEKIDAAMIQLKQSSRLTLYFDRAHLHQILWNLLNNALRYAQGHVGSIRLLVEESARPDYLNLSVTDDGCGISDAQCEHIFEPFFTTHSRGTGLGLYIARALAEANGASLSLQKSSSGAHFCMSGKARSCP
ncbi:MAG: ATP-binding protein [Pseudomonadota bacterium]